jgi:hypothetical protein
MGLNDIFFTDDENGWITGERVLFYCQYATILYTHDGGNTWETCYDQLFAHNYSLYFTDSDNGWAVGSSGNILHIENGGMVSLDESIPAETAPVMKVFPNPADEIVECHLHVPAKAGINFQRVTLRLYDLYGKEIRTLVDEAKSPGEYSVRMDVYDLPPGIYFIRVQAGGQTAVRKLVVQ